MPDYQTIRGISTFEYEEKRSRFIASAAFADTEEAALAHLNRIKAANRTARHNVYAYVLREGGRTRYSDDGEPAKTAGAPVLEAIGHAGLSDVIVDIVETGTTLRENGLQVVTEFMPISARFIANKASYQFKHQQMDTMLEKLRDTLHKQEEEK